MIPPFSGAGEDFYEQPPSRYLEIQSSCRSDSILIGLSQDTPLVWKPSRIWTDCNLFRGATRNYQEQQILVYEEDWTPIHMVILLCDGVSLSP
jgi:hypothetical protein